MRARLSFAWAAGLFTILIVLPSQARSQCIGEQAANDKIAELHAKNHALSLKESPLLQGVRDAARREDQNAVNSLCPSLITVEQDLMGNLQKSAAAKKNATLCYGASRVKDPDPPDYESVLITKSQVVINTCRESVTTPSK